MDEVRNVIFVPETAEAVTRFFHECARLQSEGLTLRVGILDSPYRPGLRFGIPNDIRKIDATLNKTVSLLYDIKNLTKALTAPSGPPSCNVFISHDKMTKVHEISPSDLLAVVDGGVRLGDFITAVKDAGLYFPLESSFLPGDMTIAVSR